MTEPLSIASLADKLRPVTAFADSVRAEVHGRDATGEYPADLVATMRELGLFGKCAGDLREYVLALEEVGRAWLSLIPIVNAHSSSVWSLKHYGTPAQQARWLAPFMAGDAVACLALTEPHAGSDLQAVTSTARQDGDEWVLDIEKTLITHSDHSDHALVLVRTGGPEVRGSKALSLFLIDRKHWTIERKLPKLGTVSVETCHIRGRDIRVPADRLIGGEPGYGFAQIMDALEVGRLAVAAAAVGVARSAMWRGIDRVREREAFGAPLAENLLVRQRLASVATRIAAAKGLLQLAAERKNAGGRHDQEASAAKIVATDAALHAATVAMELGGGMGYTEDLDFARHLRDAALFLAGEGANSVLEGLVGSRIVTSQPDLAWI